MSGREDSIEGESRDREKGGVRGGKVEVVEREGRITRE